MDSEEHHEITEAQRKGLPETDEGPYYHKTWWEGYKGGVKGLLGGLLLGACVGSVIGMGAAGIMLSMELVSTGLVGSVVAAFAAGGMLLGAEEFSTVGIVSGASAAGHEEAEIRSKKELTRAVGELKAELAELKALVPGKSPSEAGKAKEDAKALIPPPDEFKRTTHVDYNHKPEKFKPIFWKVAGIGAVIGGTAGTLLAFGGVPKELLELAGTEAAQQLSGSWTGTLAATSTVGALAGASFGINRDIFRKVFDITDHWFRGILIPGKEDVSPAPAIEQARAAEIQVQSTPAVVVEEKPKPETYFRDKIATAQRALAEMDHSQAIRH